MGETSVKATTKAYGFLIGLILPRESIVNLGPETLSRKSVSMRFVLFDCAALPATACESGFAAARTATESGSGSARIVAVVSPTARDFGASRQPNVASRSIAPAVRRVTVGSEWVSPGRRYSE